MNNYPHFTTLAQELVEASSSLLGKRTINIMDMDGIIIASSEKSRIGSFHAGALQVVESGEDLAITPENVSAYPGAKEGYNMPLVCNDEVIGVIGIYGVPSDVRDLAQLLKVYASKYFEMETGMYQTLQTTTLTHTLFHLLTDPDSAERNQKIHTLMENLNVHPHMPMIVLCLSRPGHLKEHQSNVWSLELLENSLLTCGMLLPRQDIWGFEQNTLVILKSMGGEDPVKYKQKLKQLLSKVEFAVKTSISAPADTLEKLSSAYVECQWMHIYMEGSFLDLGEDTTRLDYILTESAVRYGTFIDVYVQRLKENFKDDEFELFLQSIESYYRNQKSVTKAAAELYIHKNTLQYRVRKVWEAAGMEHQPPFAQEYLMKLIIQRIRLDH